jgi:hypothetical protein
VWTKDNDVPAGLGGYRHDSARFFEVQRLYRHRVENSFR